MFAVTLDECRCESLAFSPDSSLLAVGGSDGLVGLWRADTGRPVRHFVHDLLGSPVRSVAFSSDGALLAAVGGVHLKVRDLRSGKLILKREHPGDLIAVAIDQNSTCIATACLDGVLRLWSRRGALTASQPGVCTAATRRLTFVEGRVAPLPEEGTADGSVVRSPDGRLVATITAAGVQVAATR